MGASTLLKSKKTCIDRSAYAEFKNCNWIRSVAEISLRGIINFVHFLSSSSHR